MMPLEDSIKDIKLYYKKKLKWYEKIWYFITRRKNEYKELKGINRYE